VLFHTINHMYIYRIGQVKAFGGEIELVLTKL